MRDPSRAVVYAWAVAAAGAATILVALRELYANPVSPYCLILIGLTLASGLLRLRLASVPLSFSVSETFTIATLLLFGPAAAALIVALDGLVISVLMTKRQPLIRIVFNATAPALAMGLAGYVFTFLGPGRAAGGIAPPALLLPLAVTTAFYFVLQTGLVAGAVALSQRRRPIDVWRAGFAPLWVSYFGGAYVAVLLVLPARDLGPGYLWLLLPLPFVFHSTFRLALGPIDDHVRHIARLDTERTRAEGARRESETMFRTLAETMSAMVFIHQGDRLRYVNRALEVVTGFSRTQLLEMPAEQIAHPSWRTAFRERIHALAPDATERYELRLTTREGRERWVEVSLATIPFAGDTAVLGAAFDITERKQAQDALERLAGRYRSLIQGAAYGIYCADLDDQFTDVNPALVSMLGYPSAEDLIAASGRGEIYIDAGDRAALREAYRTTGRVQSVEVRWRRLDGGGITVRLGGRAVSDERGNIVGVEVIAEDVTERRALEDQLRQALKMEAVGRLAGGVAHDFNNLLTAIIGYSDMLHEQIENEASRRDVDEIRRAAARASDLTRQLLAFSRKQVFRPSVLDLNLRVASIETMLQRLIGENVQLRTVPAPQLWRVKGDASQIEQVIVNLVVNARDAMPAGGRLTIETRNVTITESQSRRLECIPAGRYVMLAVSDTGTGMDAETKNHLFEPFFTTKDRGKGTGLGLASVYGIVKQSGGFIFVESEPNQGSTFRIYLPQVEELPESAMPPELAPRPIGGYETVLLVEDEEAVRLLATEVLSRHGYRVLDATNGDEAMQLSQAHGASIHLLLSDIVMPAMSGPDLAIRMLAERPDLKVLFISGYTDDLLSQYNGRLPHAGLLQKPFSPTALALRVREVLDAGVGEIAHK